MPRIVLLPGLDGTGALFDGFVRAAPADLQLDVVALPREPLGYAELAERIAPRLKLTPQTVLLAESFSGPLAITIAQGQRVGALVLCNSFVVPPGPRLFAALPLTPLLHLPLPAMVSRRYLVGPTASDALVGQVRAAVGSVPPAVLAARVRSVLSVDVAAALARCTMPILYLRGTEDRAVPETSVRAVVGAASVPVTVVRIPGPHLLLQAAPDAAWRAIERFVREPRATADGVAPHDARAPI